MIRPDGCHGAFIKIKISDADIGIGIGIPVLKGDIGAPGERNKR